ncbi:MAG: alginate export family protein [Candidatus Omnitrophota bacterium]|nr:alginate export family protein [Candidatus Omnitrophota bacterium]
MKFLRVLCVLAVALCLTASVYAETQSVKVSGDLTMRSLFRNQYDYQSSPPEPDQPRTGLDSSWQSWLMSVAEIEIDADLTDNVQTVIRLVNQRDWNVWAKSDSATTGGFPNGRAAYTENDDEFDVMVDLAYVTLKDFIYSPLTVTIGRQDLWFGKGFIVGANLQNPGNGWNGSTGGNLTAPEYTAVWSFDAVKAVLDYDPWTITGVYSKIYEDAVQARDDVDLYGLNVGYKFDSYMAEAEAYWFWKADRGLDAYRNISRNTNDVHTFGLRGSFDPVDVVTVNLEGAYQGGEYVANRLQTTSRVRSAWALDVGTELRYFAEKYSWKPKFGAEFIYYSGNKPEDNTASDPGGQGTYTGWDPVYRGKFDSAIREFVGRFYYTGRYPANNDNFYSADDASYRNQFQMIFLGSLQPMDSLTLKANYNLFWNQCAYTIANDDKSLGFIGQEIDLTANWDYTEDVSFGLLCGWFVPGDVYYENMNKVTTDIVGTVKVSF